MDGSRRLTWTSLVRFAGVLLVLAGVVIAIDFPSWAARGPHGVVVLGTTYVSPAESLPSDSALGIAVYGASFLVAAVGVRLALTGKVTRRWPRNSRVSQRICRQCSYPARGRRSPVCPECGGHETIA